MRQIRSGGVDGTRIAGGFVFHPSHRATKRRESIFACFPETFSFPGLSFKQLSHAFFVHVPVFLAMRRHDFLLGAFYDFHVFKRLSVPLVRQQLLLLSTKLQHRRR
jgi:hypothetical protein